MLNKNARITIKNWVSKSQLIKAIMNNCNSEILTIFVGNDDSVLFTEFDGICITQWYIDDCYKLIDNDVNGLLYNKEIVTIL